MLGRSAPQATALGQLGSTFITDTSTHSSMSVGRIYCIAAAVLAAGTVSGNLPDGTACMSGTLTGLALSPGMEIQGYFTAIQLASGSVIAYNV